MVDFFIPALQYVVFDSYFWPAMSLTTMMSLFIGAIIYDGETKEVKKGLFSVGSYATLLILVTTARVFNHITINAPKSQPLAGVVTILCVSLFYALGMYLGVKIVKHAIVKG